MKSIQSCTTPFNTLQVPTRCQNSLSSKIIQISLFSLVYFYFLVVTIHFLYLTSQFILTNTVPYHSDPLGQMQAKYPAILHKIANMLQSYSAQRNCRIETNQAVSKWLTSSLSNYAVRSLIHGIVMKVKGTQRIFFNWVKTENNLFLNDSTLETPFRFKQPKLFLNRPISQIPQCIRHKSHNAPFCNRNVQKCAHFCYKMVHYGMWG